MKEPIAERLTVIIRDDTPLIHCGDAPSFRRVTVELTDDQIEAISINNGNRNEENYSRCFLE